MNNMMPNNMMFNNNIIGLNNIGMNNIGINNQQNLMNGLAIDTTAQNVKNIIQPYENKIKELEEIIRQKDFEIAVLKQKLNNKNCGYSDNQMNMMNNNPVNMRNNNPMNMMNNNPMNMMNNIPMNMMNNNPMNMMNNIPMNMNMFFPNFNQFENDKGKELKLKVKFENNEYNISCFENDKASILREKININEIDGYFIYNFKAIDPRITFEENGICSWDSIIEIKPLMNLTFNYLTKNCLILSHDCPLNIAIYYYLLKLNDPFFMGEVINGKISFLFNGSKLNIREETPIINIFKNNEPVVTVNRPDI